MDLFYRPHTTETNYINTICVLKENQNISTFKTLCNKNKNKAEKTIAITITTMRKIIPTYQIINDQRPSNKKYRDPRSLININLCIFSACNQENEDTPLPEIDIDGINENFNKITKQLDSVSHNIMYIQEKLNDIYIKLDINEFHNRMTSTINQIATHATTQYATLIQLYQMNRTGQATDMIIKPNDIANISQTLNTKLFQNLNSIKMKLITTENDIYVIIGIPIYETWKESTLFHATVYPTFLSGTRYQTDKVNTEILINEMNMTNNIESNNCNKKSRICNTNTPYYTIHANSQCAEKQIILPNATCHMKKGVSQENFYTTINKTVYYAVSSNIQIRLICPTINSTKEFSFRIKERGKFEYPENCIIRTNHSMIITQGTSNMTINAQDIFQHLQFIDKEQENYTKHVPIKLTIDEHPIKNIMQTSYKTNISNTQTTMIALTIITIAILATIIYLKHDRRTSHRHQYQYYTPNPITPWYGIPPTQYREYTV